MPVDRAPTAPQGVNERAAAGRRPSPSFFKRHGISPGWLWVAPMLLFLAALVFYPVLRVFYLSLFEASMLNPEAKTFVGLDNFAWALSFEMPGYDGVYLFNVLGRSLLWIFLSVALKFGLGLSGALLLNQALRGTRLYRSLVVLPWGLPWAIAAMTWGWALNTEFGFMNVFLQQALNLTKPISFFGTPMAAFLSTVMIDSWIGLPFMVVMMLAGLQAVPKDLVDAAMVDGAGTWRRFASVVFPQVRLVALTATLLSTVWTFNSFDPVWVLTRGGPLRATEILPVAIYNIGFLQLRLGGLGKASAMSVIQIALVSLIAYAYVRALRREAAST